MDVGLELAIVIVDEFGAVCLAREAVHVAGDATVADNLLRWAQGVKLLVLIGEEPLFLSVNM